MKSSEIIPRWDHFRLTQFGYQPSGGRWEVRGMMISRRPKRRASTDKAPGPSNTMAPATTISRIADSLNSIRLWVGAGNHDMVMLAQPNAVKMAPMGVRNPSSSDAPLAIASKPAIQALSATAPARYIVPWTATIIPTATRNRSSPTPGHPPGNVENNLCSATLRVPSRAPNFTLRAVTRNRIPIAWNLFVTLSCYCLQ